MTATVTIIVTVTDNLKKLKNRELVMMIMQNGTCTAKFRGTTTISLT